MKFIPVRGRKHVDVNICNIGIMLKFIPVRGRKQLGRSGYAVAIMLKFIPVRGRKREQPAFIRGITHR